MIFFQVNVHVQKEELVLCQFWQAGGSLLIGVVGQVPLQLFGFVALVQSTSRKSDPLTLVLQEWEDFCSCEDVDDIWFWFLCPDFGLPDTFLSAVKSAEVSVHADIHLQPPGQKHAAAHKAGTVLEG